MEGNDTFRVLGIDPGLHITGYAVLDFGRGDPGIAEAGTIRTNPRGQMPQRITQLYDELREIIAEFRPGAAAIEQIYAHYQHPRTAILMAHARGTILLACAQAGLDVKNLPSTMVKKALTGNGHATKLQMQRAIQAVCRLKELPSPPDVADAIAIALCAGKRMTNRL
jgi:crossover junction endodeoxyribonuclease RuvC